MMSVTTYNGVLEKPEVYRTISDQKWRDKLKDEGLSKINNLPLWGAHVRAAEITANIALRGRDAFRTAAEAGLLTKHGDLLFGGARRISEIYLKGWLQAKRKEQTSHFKSGKKGIIAGTCIIATKGPYKGRVIAIAKAPAFKHNGHNHLITPWNDISSLILEAGIDPNDYDSSQEYLSSKYNHFNLAGVEGVLSWALDENVRPIPYIDPLGPAARFETLVAIQMQAAIATLSTLNQHFDMTDVSHHYVLS